MKTMYEIYEKLLKQKGLKNADVARATGISNMTLSDWKNGKSQPKTDKMKLIANYLGVSIEYLMTGKQEQYYIDPETAAAAQEMFENPDLRMLYDAEKDISPEDLKAVYTMVMALKRKERGSND